MQKKKKNNEPCFNNNSSKNLYESSISLSIHRSLIKRKLRNLTSSSSSFSSRMDKFKSLIFSFISTLKKKKEKKRNTRCLNFQPFFWVSRTATTSTIPLSIPLKTNSTAPWPVSICSGNEQCELTRERSDGSMEEVCPTLTRQIRIEWLSRCPRNYFLNNWTFQGWKERGEHCHREVNVDKLSLLTKRDDTLVSVGNTVIYLWSIFLFVFLIPDLTSSNTF